MSNTTAEVVVVDKSVTGFVPFGAKDEVKLSIAIVKRLIAVKTKEGKLPNDEDCLRFIAMCKARRLNPFEGDAFLIGYDSREGPKFSLITAHQAFLKRAELNKEYDGMKSGIIVKRGEAMIDLEGDFYLPGDVVVGGWATVFFKNRSNPMSKRVRLERFKKGFGVWMDDAAGMICKVAEADALRSSFPTMLGGLYLQEETQHEPPAMSKPIFTTVDVPAEEPQTKPGGPDLRVQVREMCKRDGVKESNLEQFLGSIGLSDGEVLDATKPETLEQVIADWPTFLEKIKEVCG